jgi:hypothetical protein
MLAAITTIITTIEVTNALGQGALENLNHRFKR